MKMIFIGLPGSGKGTQAERLAKHFQIPRITTGDLFRSAIKNQTPLGKKVKTILDQGSLVPNEITLEVTVERMGQSDCKAGFILDGFPRTIVQADGLEHWLKEKRTKLDHVVLLEISKEEAVNRNTGRRQCEKCGTSFHLQFSPPKSEGVCDRCGGKLIQRKDDQEATVRRRLEVYEQETAPLIQYYEKKGLLRRINGSLPPDQVFQSLLALQ